MGSNLFGLAKGAAQNYVDTGKEEEQAIDELISSLGTHPKENEPTEEDLYRYILGPEEEGKERKRNLEEISTFSDFVDSWDITDLQFTKDETMEIDISPLVRGLTAGCPAVNIEPNCTDYIYITYKNKVYRITVNESDYYATDLEKVYEPKGREGEKVEYSYDGTEVNKKEWTIIKDNQDGTVEIVSPETIGSLTLKGDSGYNDAIEMINNYCKDVITAVPSEEKDKVRSVGAKEDYTDDNDRLWASVKNGDTYYEDDVVRMGYYNIINTEISYWFASRCLSEENNGVERYIEIRSCSTDRTYFENGFRWLGCF